jgi:hypothetical protein
MRLSRVFGLMAFTAAVTAFPSAEAQTPKKKLQQQQAAQKAADDAKKAPVPVKKDDYAKDAKPAEPLVPKAIGNGKDAPAVAAVIDSHIDRVLAENKIAASPTCSDADFVRRVYLDITGVIPTGSQAREFLDDQSPDKRAKLIDQLLAGSHYGRHMADVWMGLLVQRSSDNRRISFESLRTWLDEEFNKNAGWDKVVAELVTSSGDQEKHPAVGFFLSNNTVDKMTDEVCKVFLGLQLQCAQCHNHPFTGWKQTEYWGMAQFFMKVEVDGIKAKDAKPSIQESNSPKRGKNNMLPESAKFVSAKFLQADEPRLDKSGPYRPVLAKWMTGKTNPFFATAMVNRTWAQFFGRGIVNPVDDMHGKNEPSHPDLLNALAADFAASGFDLKHLVRSICNSQAYQRSSKPTGGNDRDEFLFSHMAMKQMSPEQLFDSLAAVTGADKADAARGPKGANAKIQQQGPREKFVNFFLAGADQASTTEYEAGIPQALKLMNSKISGSPAVQRQFAGPGSKPAEVVEKLYLATLSRRPTEAEAKKLTGYMAKAGTPAEACGDILWALLNSSEFAMVR